MNIRIYVEGGGESKELKSRCREGFRRLMQQCGFKGRMPRLIACGGRSAAYDDFLTAYANANPGDYVALWVDSEDPMADIERAWDHLLLRDNWQAPSGANDEQVLLMVTCMETWVAVDKATLRKHYGAKLQESALPPLNNMENRARNDICKRLEHATRNCINPYTKGKRSFEILGKLNPAVLRKHLPSFARCERILSEKLC